MRNTFGDRFRFSFNEKYRKQRETKLISDLRPQLFGRGVRHRDLNKVARDVAIATVENKVRKTIRSNGYKVWFDFDKNDNPYIKKVKQ